MTHRAPCTHPFLEETLPHSNLSARSPFSNPITLCPLKCSAEKYSRSSLYLSHTFTVFSTQHKLRGALRHSKFIAPTTCLALCQALRAAQEKDSKVPSQRSLRLWELKNNRLFICLLQRRIKQGQGTEDGLVLFLLAWPGKHL